MSKLKILKQIWSKIDRPNSYCPDVEIGYVLDVLAKVGEENGLGKFGAVKRAIKNKPILNIEYSDTLTNELTKEESDQITDMYFDNTDYTDVYLVTDTANKYKHIIFISDDFGTQEEDLMFFKYELGLMTHTNSKTIESVKNGFIDLPNNCNKLIKLS